MTDRIEWYKLGIDIGGTNVAMGIVDQDGTVYKKRSIPYPSYERSPERRMEIIAEEAKELEREFDRYLNGMGAAVPGSVDSRTGVITDAYNLGLHNADLYSVLRRYFPFMPISVMNDADAAAIAEHDHGALQDVENGAVLTLGTGLGGGLIINGRLFSGGLGNGCELGHSTLVHGGEKCTCGNEGCAEVYCSATALVRLGREAALSGKSPALKAALIGGLTARRIIELAREGDEGAREAFYRYADYLSSFAASLFNLLDLELIALGGGVSGAGDFLFDAVNARLDDKCFYKRHGKVAGAALGNDAGLIGCVGEANKNPYSLDYRGYFSR